MADPEESVARIENCVSYIPFYFQAANDPQAIVNDLLADLAHYCHAHDIDFAAAANMAEIHCESERQEAGVSPTQLQQVLGTDAGQGASLLRKLYGVEPAGQKLSSVPSEAILQICDDLDALQALGIVRFNGNSWITASRKTCEVCLAGAAMLRRPDLNLPPLDSTVFPESESWARDEEAETVFLNGQLLDMGDQYLSLDQLRYGNVTGFMWGWERWLKEKLAESGSPEDDELWERVNSFCRHKMTTSTAFLLENKLKFTGYMGFSQTPALRQLGLCLREHGV